jgi:hypothetical protein
MAQTMVIAQTKLEHVEAIYKENRTYYMVIEPKKKDRNWFYYFISFDSVKVNNVGHANMFSYKNRDRVKKWQIMDNTLYYLAVSGRRQDINNPYMNNYYRYNLDSVFKIIEFNLTTINKAPFFSHSLPLHVYRKDWLANYQYHTWYDLVHTKNEFTCFTSLSDTTLIIKDILDDFSESARNVKIREQIYTFPHLGRFNVFKINDDDFVLNDIGDFYHLQDSVPKLIGHLEFQTVNQVFYLKDNDTGTLSFNCRFVPLYPEYENLVGYIDPEHWLYTRYFKIKEEYMEELHELNRKTWR